MGKKDLYIGFLLFIVCFAVLSNLLPPNDFYIGLTFFFSISSVFIPFILRSFTKKYRKEKLIGEASGTVYDPQESLEQTEEGRIRQYIKVFGDFGYKKIANEYRKFLKKEKYDFTHLPQPEELKSLKE